MKITYSVYMNKFDCLAFQSLIQQRPQAMSKTRSLFGQKMTEMFNRYLLKKAISNEMKKLDMYTLDDGQINCTEEKSAIRKHKHCNNQFGHFIITVSLAIVSV